MGSVASSRNLIHRGVALSREGETTEGAKEGARKKEERVRGGSRRRDARGAGDVHTTRSFALRDETREPNPSRGMRATASCETRAIRYRAATAPLPRRSRGSEREDDVRARPR